ncbi:Pimeloyl-ACP methyl ester carboxylesterase [Enhydrobacter aerosaccus]|uniref:Pimeloyl-ACP methyl ester carboxylesterase n=1 Tax=Enhydrobacter aerosaccus TaxID=225324 RepID=A0A1T4JM62_9HYPH|nr:alpha/beta hydrolase [Enhydrobacter aerosaccus]SJZ31187.1 Pimeloyl-ACP methyl ester carboxylesterase [Enhydrobacter aerosaccus]
MEELSLVGVDGNRLAASVVGRGDQPAILLAHGGGQTRHAWGNTIRKLSARGYRAIALDLRGHGDSDWSEHGRYELDAFAEDLIAVARHLGRPPAIVGASLGGLAALVAEGEKAPGTFSSLTLVDVTPRMEMAGIDRIVGFMTAHVQKGFGSIDEAADVIADYLPHRQRRRNLNGLTKNLRLGPDGRYRWHWDPRFITNVQPPEHERRFERLENAARRVGCPIHLVRGGMSDLVSEEVTKAFLELVPGARYSNVADAGHMVVGDQNDRFSDAVLGFLETLYPTK